MIVKFETEHGYRIYDKIDYVDWTLEVKNTDGNEVSTTIDPFKNWDWVSDDSLNEIPKIIGQEDNEGSVRSHFNVDAKFVVDSRGKESIVPRLIHLKGLDGKLRVFYTEAMVYLLNDNGKTIERI